ncbi:MAG: 2OG-Fe(II) oxygenase [Pseudomonadales bacterium]
MTHSTIALPIQPDYDDSALLRMVDDLTAKQFSVQPGAMPQAVQTGLCGKLENMSQDRFDWAQIGRGVDEQQNHFVRKNSVHWLNEADATVQTWFAWIEQLRQTLNRHLFLGLDSFESHLALYQPGNFYRRHTDAFRGERNRVVSLVAYLNEGWQPDQGGELVLYPDNLAPIKVTPEIGTVVLFLSEEIPHEVLTTQRTRFGVAGWFRVRSGNLLNDLT